MPRTGEMHWQCLNRACGLVALSADADRALETRVCICGSPMTKRVQLAVFSYLDFLREEEAASNREKCGEERGPCER